MFSEHAVVTVTVDLPEQGLSAGDVGAVVHCDPEGDSYEVDVLDDHGHPKGVATIAGSQLLKLNLSGLLAS